jgi:hypothetical protein
MSTIKSTPMAVKFIKRWNRPFKITKTYSKVNYKIENIADQQAIQTR